MMASLERQYFWGCTLSKEKPEIKWLEKDDKDSMGEIDILNQLALSQACLGQKAKDISHVIQVTTKGLNSNTITQPIIVLGSGVRQVQCRLEFSTAATFKLIEGQGPVHLSGSHIQVLSEGYEDSDDDESIDEGISSGKQSPLKDKRPNMSPKGKEQRPPAKKAKLEIENGEDESSDGEPDELIPIKAMNEKASKKPEIKEKKAPVTSAAKKTAKPADEEDEDEDEDEDEEDDDDDDMDFDGDSSDEDSEDDDFDDEDDDDDDDDDENDDEDDDDDDDEDSSKKKSGKPQQNAKNNRKPNEDKKPPAKKQTPTRQTPKKNNVDASVNLQKTPDLNAIKQKLLKSPNLPKKIDKFKNFMKTNMKITDEKVVKDMWTYVQSNKK